MRTKTKWCESCKKRHPLNHEHFRNNQSVDPAVSVVGASTAEELAGQVAGEVANEQAKKQAKKQPEKKKVDPAEEERRRKAAERLGKRFASVPFTVTAFATHNKQWRTELKEEELQGLQEDWTAFMMAWGIEAVGKIGAAMALALGYGEAFGNVYSRIKTQPESLEQSLQ